MFWKKRKPRIKLSDRRPTLVVTDKDGSEKHWAYDVVELRLELESCSTIEQFQKVLVSKGLDGCTAEVAYKLRNLVNAQFTKISQEVEQQVSTVCG